MREEVIEGWRNLHSDFFLYLVLFVRFDESDKNIGGRDKGSLYFVWEK
jgi:hypothetical protein